MGTTTESIPFFSDEIIILPHSASRQHHVNRPISIREFANGNPCSLERVIETNEYICRTRSGDDIIFIQGKETLRNP